VSHLEDTLALHLRAAKLDSGLVREHRFHSSRLWRFDFAFPDRKIAIECEGGVWTGGRHNRGKGAVADMEKYNEAALLGWRILRFAVNQINSGEALQVIERALAC
jgi:very-short-patch-repair endonuclease